jgi:RNA polymerase sigma-70 factor (ECF subfamily)
MEERPNNPGERLEQFREYLHLLARLQLQDRLRGKVDVSGVVQQTLLEAFETLRRSPDRDSELKAAWLRQILANNLRDEVRKFDAAARDVNREHSLQAALENSASQLESWLAAEQSSPSRQAIRNETLVRLADALAQLPEDQRIAVEFHHLKGLKLDETARHLSRSKGAVAQLLFRGLKRLRELMGEPEGE